MSTLIITCKSCNGERLGAYEVADHGLLAAILLSRHHAAVPHTGGHQLEISIAGVPVGLPSVESPTPTVNSPGKPLQIAQDGSATPPPGQPLAAFDGVSTTFLALFQSMAIVEVECTQDGCAGKGVRRRWSVPRWFAGSVPILHHTTHEGHAFRIWLDGVEIQPVEEVR